MEARVNRGPSVAAATPLTKSEAGGGKRRLIMASNRGPLAHHVDGNGELCTRGNPGGVATALSALTADVPLTWFANVMGEGDRVLAETGEAIGLGQEKRLRLVAPDRESNDLFYGTFCNPTLWFLHHNLWDRMERSYSARELRNAWEHGYLTVNQTFAEAIVAELDRARGHASVMLHDYHFYAAPLFIRNLRPHAALQQFIHIPWPEPDAWSQLPRDIVQSICEGLLANDSVVFQTEQYAEHFVATCEAYLATRTTPLLDGVVYRGRRTRVWANPVSVDIWDLRSRLAQPKAQEARARLEAKAGERTIVRVDRLDPSKNVAGGFRAYGRLLEQHPEWRGKVRFLAFLVPSRTAIPEYRHYEAETFAEVTAINRRYGTLDWTPITLFYEQNRAQALAALSLYDVLLVNPLVDGLNLVSKEGPVLNERDGVLVLSSTAGSFAELQGGAIAVDPFDIEAGADALHQALSMDDGERRERAQRLRSAIFRHDLARWLRLLLEDLEGIAGAAPAVRAFPGY